MGFSDSSKRGNSTRIPDPWESVVVLRSDSFPFVPLRVHSRFNSVPSVSSCKIRSGIRVHLCPSVVKFCFLRLLI